MTEKERAYHRKWRTTKKGRACTYRNNQRRRKLVASFKDKPCHDCHVKYPPYVMQFHHIKGRKKFNIAHARSEAALKREIAKCILLCANCHAERTWGK